MKNLFIALLMCVGLSAHAQQLRTTPFKTDAGATTQSKSNAVTSYITAPSFGVGPLGIQIVITKGTGTVAGTLTLLGSVDGTNFEAVRLADVTTALHTYTATDVASQTFIWGLTTNRYNHYRIAWSGGTTQTATYTGTVTVKN